MDLEVQFRMMKDSQKRIYVCTIVDRIEGTTTTIPSTPEPTFLRHRLHRMHPLPCTSSKVARDHSAHKQLN